MLILIAASYFPEYLRELRHAGHDTEDGAAVCALRGDWISDFVDVACAAGHRVEVTIWNRASGRPATSNDFERQADDYLCRLIGDIAPDIVLFTDLDEPGVRVRRRIRRISSAKLVLQCGQSATAEKLTDLDLLLTPSAKIARELRALGLAVETHVFGHNFNRQVPKFLPNLDATGVTLVGQIGTRHNRRRTIAEALAASVPEFEWYGPAGDKKGASAALVNCFLGEAFGDAMRSALARAPMTLNCPPDCDDELFGMMRTFEASGAGVACLMPATVVPLEGFRPFEHYIPYESTAEAVSLAQRSIADEAWSIHIGAQAHDLVRRLYPVERTIGDLLERMLNVGGTSW